LAHGLVIPSATLPNHENGWTTPKLLITGGAGTLGRGLVRHALDHGWRVRATYWQRPIPLSPHSPVELVRADVRDAPSMAAAVRGVDAVIHTAYRQGDDEWSTNVDGSDVVARAAGDARLVHLSTDLVFDGLKGRYREDDEPAPVSSYGKSKLEAEHRVRAAKPSATLVRTSLIYGVPDGPQERLARKGMRFFEDELRSPIHVEDLADSLLELLELDRPGPLHVAGADDVSRYEFALLLGADPEKIERARTTPDRAPDVTLDSSCARGLLSTRLRGVRAVLGDRSSLRATR
jgi:dTDP-4-dehydrorhamnose reductase